MNSLFLTMKRVHLFVLSAALVLAAGLLSNCSGGGSAGGSGPPARIPINTATGWSDSPMISRDGQRLYFMYSRYDFGPWIKSGGTTTPVVSGPDRPGLHHSANPWDESDIYMATRNPDGTWSEAVNLGLNGAYGDSSGMEIDGGNTFIWLQGNGAGNDIVMAKKALDGTWSGPVNLGSGVNNHGFGVFQDNPHLSPDGKGLWFTSNRAGGRDIWFSLYSGGSWSTPVNMGAPFSAAGDDDQLWIQPVPAGVTTPEIYWNTSSGLKRCTWNGSACAATPELVTIPGCLYAAEASITDDGQYLYFGCGDLATGRVSIMYSVKQPDGSWGQATSVDLGATATIDPWNPPVGALVSGATLTDGWSDLRVLPAPVNITGGWTDSVTVSADGRRLYYSYGLLDFGDVYSGLSYTSYSGMLRTGMTGSAFKMFRADLGANGWTETFLPFNGDPAVDEWGTGLNADEDVAVFDRSIAGQYDLYYTLRSGAAWSAPIALPSPINTPCNDDNGFIVGTINAGLTLFFESTRTAVDGSACGAMPGARHHIYYTDYTTATGFSSAAPVPGLNGTDPGDDDSQPFFSADRTTAYWTGIRSSPPAYGIFTAVLSGGSYTNVHPVIQPTFAAPFTGKLVLVGEANVVEFSQGWLMYMMCGIAGSETGGPGSQPRDVELKVCVARKLKTP